MIDPDFQLDDSQRALLIILLGSEGFPIFKQLMEAEIERFRNAMIDANPAKPEEVLAAHAVCKAAAQFYTSFINRLNKEVGFYTAQKQVGQIAPDVTADMF